jgi:lantibiotic modifying enzyme
MVEFLANSYIILIVGIVAAIVTMISLEMEKEGVATTAVSIALALLLWNYGRDVWEFVKNDYASTTLFVLGYLVAGVIWSFLKWNEFVKRKINIFKKTKAKLIIDRPDFDENNDNHVSTLCDKLRNNGINVWGSSVKSMAELKIKVMPIGSENKSAIVAWISYWPLSLLATLLNNPFRRLFEYTYSLVANAYDKISERHFKSLVD